jgi:pimeloyl-ACP methyl ester carboxylesterase
MRYLKAMLIAFFSASIAGAEGSFPPPDVICCGDALKHVRRMLEENQENQVLVDVRQAYQLEHCLALIKSRETTAFIVVPPKDKQPGRLRFARAKCTQLEDQVPGTPGAVDFLYDLVRDPSDDFQSFAAQFRRILQLHHNVVQKSEPTRATVIGYKLAGDPDLINNRGYLVDGIDGFNDISASPHAWSVKVQFQQQAPFNAPVAVLLPGLNSLCEDNWVRYWRQLMWASGCHVLSFDSVYMPEVGDKSLHGVAGNLEREAEVVDRIIHKFCEDRGLKSNRVYVVGVSYGALIALNMLVPTRADAQRHSGIDRVLALCPPVRMRDTAEILDGYFLKEYREIEESWRDYGPQFKAYEPLKGHEYRLSERTTKGIIAHEFREALREVVSHNDKLYHLAPLWNAGSAGKRLKDAGFVDYFEIVAGPYWSGITPASVKGADSLWQRGDLAWLLPRISRREFRVYISGDDPWNKPETLRDFRASPELRSSGLGLGTVPVARGEREPSIVLVTEGGHLGWMCAPWFSQKMKEYLAP